MKSEFFTATNIVKCIDGCMTLGHICKLISRILIDDISADACFPGHPLEIRIFTSYEELIGDYEKGDLHPADLKPALSKALNRILQVYVSQFSFK